MSVLFADPALSTMAFSLAAVACVLHTVNQLLEAFVQPRSLQYIMTTIRAPQRLGTYRCYHGYSAAGADDQSSGRDLIIDDTP